MYYSCPEPWELVSLEVNGLVVRRSLMENQEESHLGDLRGTKVWPGGEGKEIADKIRRFHVRSRIKE